MLVVVHLLTRRLFAVPFDWPRLARIVAIVGGISVAGELLLPTSGVEGFALRALALAAVPVALAPELLRLRRELVSSAGLNASGGVAVGAAPTARKDGPGARASS